MSAPKIGDRVRVVLEGDVLSRTGDRIPGSFTLSNGITSFVVHDDAPALVSVEVLPRPLKVGDTIEGDQYENAPVGIVAFNPDNGQVLMRTSSGWRDQHNGYPVDRNAPRDPRTVVYLPEPTP